MKDARKKRMDDERAQRELSKELGDIDKVRPRRVRCLVASRSVPQAARQSSRGDRFIVHALDEQARAEGAQGAGAGFASRATRLHTDTIGPSMRAPSRWGERKQKQEGDREQQDPPSWQGPPPPRPQAPPPAGFPFPPPPPMPLAPPPPGMAAAPAAGSDGASAGAPAMDAATAGGLAAQWALYYQYYGYNQQQVRFHSCAVPCLSCARGRICVRL